MRWRIELLGWLRAVRAEEAVSRFRTQKTAALLAYLAHHRKRSQTREALIEMLWPEGSLQAGRNNLSQALSSLRHQLEPPGVRAGSVIVASHAAVQLHPDMVTTDVAELEAALAAARGSSEGLARAVEIYRGDLLPGHDQEWVIAERERLREIFLQSVHRLVLALEKDGDLPRALDYARRAVTADPLREEAHRDLMRLHAVACEPAAALAAYRGLASLLERELGVAPDPATQRLAREIEQVPGKFARPFAPPAAEPALLRAAAAPDRLPMSLTRFFGREEDLSALLALLEPGAARLVTLTGHAGTGKTRLALEAARRLAPAREGRVWYAPMAELADARLVPEAILGALDLHPDPRADPLEQAAAALSRRPSLLLVDDFEHLIAEGALIVRRLLERAPLLACLVTSRQRLGLEGERELTLRPLPEPEGPDLPERLMRLPSVQLFVDRAQAVRPDFELTVANAAAVAEVCRRLEGIPLALELAAARALVLSPAQMLERLDRPFELLVSRRRDASARHKTLRAALDWSHQLLAPELQRLFARLSVFRGGWSLEAAEQICEEPLALDRLAELAECSLVVAEEDGDTNRFRLLETLREYARELVSDEERAALERRHAAHFMALAEEAAPRLTGPEQASWLARLEKEHDNLRAALQWSLGAEPELGLRLAAALGEFWYVRGHFMEGRRWLARLLGAAPGPSPVRAEALARAGALAYGQGEADAARAAWEEALALRRQAGDIGGEARLLQNLGLAAWAQDRLDQARALFEESLALSRRAGEERSLAYCLSDLGNLAWARADHAAARALYEESLAILRRLGDRRGLAQALNNLGHALHGLGDPAAGALHEESLGMCVELGDKRGMANARASLAALSAEKGDRTLARALYGEALALFREMGDEGAARRAEEGLSGL